ncbi:MAG: ATP-binding cassette domain-containing protein [Candidatus Lokiarchaeota archaeon]|nr:ATP-binding cassette domain-containing protein [Candidatus Lokiarchaeota archaeon]
MSKAQRFAVELQSISKTYISGEVKVEALKEIDLRINKGERVVVLGPSGSGKTTLLNLLGGITLADEDGEKLTIFETDILKFDRSKMTSYRRDRVGFIFQFFNLFPALTAIDNVIIGIELLNKKADEKLDTRQIAKDYLSKVGLGERLHHYPSQLSGGEQQRVAIARALAKVPFVGKKFILLCDEPTGNLDTITGGKVLDLMKEINEEIEITIVLVTHNQNIAKSFATNIVRLKNGKIDNQNDVD